MLKYIAIVLIAYYCHHLYTNHTHKDLMMLLQVNENMDAKAIKMLSHTHTVYKVKHLYIPNGTVTWNYAVLAKGFLTDESRNTYVSAIQYFNFVENSEVNKIYADPVSKVICMNVAIKFYRIIGKLFGNLPSRPLKPQIPPIVKCETVDVRQDDPLFGISFMRFGNETALREYGKIVFSKFFSTLNVEMVYSGFPYSERFPEFNIQRYDSRKTFCEYMESELVIKYGELFLKAFAEIHAYTAAEI